MLARLRQDADELSLCFDSTSGLVGEFEEGQALFDDGQLSESTTAILKFCEEFELSAQRTNAFMKELAEMDLLIDGEVSIQPSDSPTPFVYRGFRMVGEEKMKELRGDQLRKINQNGILQLLMAHHFSLPQIARSSPSSCSRARGRRRSSRLERSSFAIEIGRASERRTGTMWAE
jgi:hypothetical protein